jgi:hypothetical protein
MRQMRQLSPTPCALAVLAEASDTLTGSQNPGVWWFCCLVFSDKSSFQGQFLALFWPYFWGQNAAEA